LAAREVDPTMPVIAQMTIGVDGVSPFGVRPADIAKALDRFGADIVGLNCSVGPQAILDAIEKMAPATRRKLSAQPNAGMPRDVGGRSMYMASPEYMATYARHLIQAGARVVGGCCGTTPEHTRAMAEGVRPLAPRHATVAASAGGGRLSGGVAAPSEHVGVPSVPFAERSSLAAKLAKGEFVSSVEIVPPRGVDASRMLRDVTALRDAGIDAVNVPDGPRAQSRMSAVLVSILIQQNVAGIEAVTHYCCRDRNFLGMLSDLLGAAAMGLKNLLLITGTRRRWVPIPMQRRSSTSTRSGSRISSRG
jgi:homocysteine S-methyltransferase